MVFDSQLTKIYLAILLRSYKARYFSLKATQFCIIIFYSRLDSIVCLHIGLNWPVVCSWYLFWIEKVKVIFPLSCLTRFLTHACGTVYSKNKDETVAHCYFIDLDRKNYGKKHIFIKHVSFWPFWRTWRNSEEITVRTLKPTESSKISMKHKCPIVSNSNKCQNQIYKLIAIARSFYFISIPNDHTVAESYIARYTWLYSQILLAI